MAWRSLSPRSLEVVREIGSRAAAGLSPEEIAEALDRERPVLGHHGLLHHVTRAWVAQRLAELRREIRSTPGVA